MLEYTTGYAALPLSVGAAACMLCILVLMGLKIKWFRARMTFDQPAPTQTAYVGVYRSTFSDDVFDYRRPSILPGPISTTTQTNTASSSKARPVSSPAFTNSAAGSSKSDFTNTSVNGRPVSTMTVVNETKSQNFNVEVNTKMTTGNAAKSSTPTQKSGIRIPLFRSKSKDLKTEESLVKEVKVKETKTKEVKVKEQKANDVKSKEPKVKAVKTKDPVVKEVKPKEPKVKDVKTKESKTKDAKTKSAKPKDPKNKAAKTQPPNSQISQNNAFPYVQSTSGQPRPPPMPQEGVPLLDDGGFVYIQTKSQTSQQGAMPPTMKTFGSLQPTRGQTNPMLTPIPSQENRGFRNPAAMGMSAYKSPKALSDSIYDTPSSGGNTTSQQLYGMEEESES